MGARGGMALAELPPCPKHGQEEVLRGHLMTRPASSVLYKRLGGPSRAPEDIRGDMGLTAWDAALLPRASCLAEVGTSGIKTFMGRLLMEEVKTLVCDWIKCFR